MKLKYITLITIFVPTFVFATFGDQFNSLLEQFFSGKDPVSTEEIISRPEPNIPTVEVSTATDVRRAIFEEEDSLQQIENELRQNEQALTNIKDERGVVAFQLEQLDSDLGVRRILQKKQNEAMQLLRRELEVITRRKSEIEATLRQQEREQQKTLSKKFIQSSLQENFGQIAVWQWVFSDISISQLIEQQRREQHIEDTQRKKVLHLKGLQKDLKKEEKRIADIFLRVQDLERQSAQQQMLLADLSVARANILARLEFSQGELENAISSARKQQAASTVALQDLRMKLGDDFDKEPIRVEQKLLFPLPIEPQITASFLDPEYKKALGRDHFGTDFWAPQGTPILAPMDGVIKKVAQNGYAYSYLIIDHGNDLFTLFGHISDVNVQEGQVVTRGEIIGKTGGTPGLPGSGFFTTGPHLHFEVFAGGRHVDPEKWLKQFDK